MRNMSQLACDRDLQAIRHNLHDGSHQLLRHELLGPYACTWRAGDKVYQLLQTIYWYALGCSCRQQSHSWPPPGPSPVLAHLLACARPQAASSPLASARPFSASRGCGVFFQGEHVPAAGDIARTSLKQWANDIPIIPTPRKLCYCWSFCCDPTLPVSSTTVSGRGGVRQEIHHINILVGFTLSQRWARPCACI